MRARYKNKRDQYKSERDEFERKATRLENELTEKKESDKKRYSATVYCRNCKYVSNVEIPPKVSIESGDCVHCRVRGELLLVISYPGKI